MITMLTMPKSCGSDPWTALQPGRATPFEFGANVVVNGWVGFAMPEMVTVAADGFVVVVPFAVLPIANCFDCPNRIPEVEFMKSR